MNNNVIGIYDGRWETSQEAGFMARFQRVQWNKANPRNREYMEALFSECYPEGVFLDVTEDVDWVRRIDDADTVVLLYPDATGLGFRSTETKVRQHITAQSLRVLNGRRRDFDLDSKTRRDLALRRFMERWMVGEFALLVPFLVVTPILLIFDLLRRRT